MAISCNRFKVLSFVRVLKPTEQPHSSINRWNVLDGHLFNIRENAYSPRVYWQYSSPMLPEGYPSPGVSPAMKMES